MRDQLLGGRYRLVQQLGQGGMGQVWEAQDGTLGRPVAVKVISLLAGGGSRGDEARARFLREARITAKLQHPNIVTVHDLGETGTGDSRVPFLVMELVRGEGLDAILRRGAVTLPDAARWGVQICDALSDAHNAGIMHRDIKPSNILITPSAFVKVLDFGVARAADPYVTVDRLTQTGFIVGTPPYMAPEQARGFPEPRSDLYALGCLLFELITGRLPFQSPDTVGYLSAHLTQEPPAPSSVSTGIPTAWDDLVLTLLKKDPDDRYANAGELADALRRLETVDGSAVTSPGTAPLRITDATGTPELPEPETERLPEHVPEEIRPTKHLPKILPESRPTRKSAVAISVALLLVCTAVVSTVLYTTRDKNGHEGADTKAAPSAAPVRFKSIPDICGNLSDESFLDTLIDYRRPADSKTTGTQRECGWTTEESAPSDVVDSELTFRAQKFASTKDARSHMRKEGDTGFDGSKIVALGKPGEFGDEALIDVYKEDVNKSVGGEIYSSSDMTHIVFRTGNLCVELTYMRSRSTGPKPADTSYTRQGAVAVAHSTVSSLGS